MVRPCAPCQKSLDIVFRNSLSLSTEINYAGGNKSFLRNYLNNPRVKAKHIPATFANKFIFANRKNGVMATDSNEDYFDANIISSKKSIAELNQPQTEKPLHYT